VFEDDETAAPAASATDMDENDDELVVLQASYERLSSERDRLRSARGFFSRPLGPAPASAGISTALVATLGSNLDTGFVWAAVGTLAVLVLVGIAYDGKPAYRHLYARELAGVRTTRRTLALWRRRAELDALAAEAIAADDGLGPAAWYREMIRREREVLGDPTIVNHHYAPWAAVATLQQGLDLERTGLRAVQALWLGVIVLLVLAVLD
jgi:hypothetical protein